MLKRYIKFTYDVRADMERDFWSTENVPIDIKKSLIIKSILMKLVVFTLVMYAITMCSGQLILNIFPKWPFITDQIYPFYIIAYTIYAVGEFVVVYTHCLIYMYHCYHAYCQTFLLSEYFKRMAKDFSKMTNQKKINSKLYQAAMYNRMLFGIKQHERLVR